MENSLVEMALQVGSELAQLCWVEQSRATERTLEVVPASSASL